MSRKSEFRYFLYVVLVCAAWVPVSAWLMPRISDAPTWNADPAWYLSSSVMAIVLSYVARFLVNRFFGK